MREQRATVEIIAPSVEEAVAKGLEELLVQREDVEIEVLDEGTRGIFGLGSRQARIRLTIKSRPTAGEKFIEEKVETPAAVERDVRVEPVEPVESRKPIADNGLNEDLVVHVAQETVNELLDLMMVKADVNAHFGQEDEGRTPVIVDIMGKDLTILIGKRAETLGALQYIASLITSKKLGRSVNLVVDVENYRERREIQVRQLARRMADQAIKTGRRQVLEPMPANERRIVHIELRENEQVRTESIGDEPYRKVTIVPVE
jgi:spoIIIJ-associated protein